MENMLENKRYNQLIFLQSQKKKKTPQYLGII